MAARSPRPAIQLIAAEVIDLCTPVLIGRDAAGDSVAVELRGMWPRVWVRVPDAWRGPNGAGVSSSIWACVMDELNEQLCERAKMPQWVAERVPRDEAGARIYIHTEGSGAVRNFKRFYGYEEQGHDFVCIQLTTHWAMRALRTLLSRPKRWRDVALGHMPPATRPDELELAEADIDFTVQVCADLGLTPGGWFTMRREATPVRSSRSRTAFTYYANAEDLVPRPELTGLAPLRVLSFDIETLSRDIGNGAVKFFDGDDPEGKCLCIAACSSVVGRPGVQRVVFAIDPDMPPGAPVRQETHAATGGDGSVQLHWFRTEAEVLLAFSGHMREEDPDFVTGWNVDRFDWGWLALASKRLGIESDVFDISRFNFPRAFYDTRYYGQNADKQASRKKVILKLPGRVPYDLMTWMKKNYHLASYTLSSVAEHNKCGAKDDVAYSEIGELFKTQDGRLKLALYCEQDTSLVLKLIAKSDLDPVGKDMALCSIAGVWPADLLGRGTQHTLRCKMLRVAHARGFILPFVPGVDFDAEVPADGASDDEEDEDMGYQGGKVLTALSGRYTDPVAVFDFGSLYPSCMEQHNICKSSQLTRALAKELNVPFTVPPAPSLTGRWRTPDGEEVDIKDDFRTGVITVGTDAAFRYETDLNEVIIAPGGRRAVLEDSGYALRWVTADSVWRRYDEDVLCFTQREFFTGLVPQLEADLKKDRNAAKARKAQANAAGDSALQQFENNLQNSIKVLMNGLYGGYGTAKGGIFPQGFKLAAAITATGRGWICTVKKIIESRMWVGSDQRWGIDDKPDDAQFVRVVYGDTDSVFCHLPGLSLQTAADFSYSVSKFFSNHILPYPQKLEFEKIYYPFVLYKKKMYSGNKFVNQFGDDAESELNSRGIALVRRDNASLVRTIMKQTLERMLRLDVNADDVVESVARYMDLVRRSIGSMHAPNRAEDHLPLDQFVLSAGLSKDLEEYEGPPNCAAHIAVRLMQINPLETLGAGTRVTFVIRAAHADAKRGEQACLKDDLVRERFQLDTEYYLGAIRKKCEPLLSALFVGDESKTLTFKSMLGGIVRVQHSKASERDALPGQTEAARRLKASLALIRRATLGVSAAEPPTRVAPVFARVASAPSVPRAPVVTKPADASKKRKAAPKEHPAFTALRARASRGSQE